MRQVEFDAKQERIFVATAEISDRDAIVAARDCNAPPVGTIDDPHRFLMYDDRRKLFHDLEEAPNVRLVFSGTSWR